MSDAELLTLLAEKSPRDFSATEIAALRERWPQSSDVREALLDVLQVETALLAEFASVSLNIDQLMARAAGTPGRRGIARQWWWLAPVIAVIAASVWWFRTEREPEPVPPVIAPPPIADVQPQEQAFPPVSAWDAIAAASSSSTQRPPTTPAPQPVTESDPWVKWLHSEARPLPLDNPQLLGDLRSIQHDELSLDEFRRWWSEVPGYPLQWNQSLVGNRRTVQFNGTARLLAPWQADTWLRWTPFDVQECTLYFWSGETGVALQFYRSREPHLWAAFAVERSKGQVQPHRWGLLATDSGRIYRSGVATLEVHHHNGRLVLSVAQAPAIVVPMSQPPAEAVLHGTFRLRGASWVRAEPLPLSTPRAHSLAWSALSSELPWEGAHVTLEQRNDGGLSWRSEAGPERATTFVCLPQAAVYEVITRIESGDPGTGVFVGDAAGKPLAVLSLLKERRTGQLTMAALRPNERRVETDYDPRAVPPPYLSESQFVRLTAGWGVLHVAVSGDGVHWGELVESPLRDIRGAVQSVGLFAQPGDTARSIKLRQLEVRRLDAFTTLAESALLPRVPLAGTNPPRDLMRWETRALEQRPADAATSNWLDTCAVATLQSGPATELVGPLVERLAASATARDWAPSTRWACYSDMLQLIDAWGERDSQVWSKRFAAERSSQTGARDAWRAWMASLVWTHGGVRDEFHLRLAAELLELTARRDWNAAGVSSRFALHLAATAHPDQPPRDNARVLEQIARWSRGMTGEADVGRRDASGEVFPASWRHPFSPQLDKEAYNTRGELEAALQSGALRDAARIALTLGATSSGLLPDTRESNLFVTLPVALASAGKDHPEFVDLLRKEFTATGLLRFRQAAERFDLDAVNSIPLQFFGTPAAAAACEWLGDREMSLGNFGAAWRAYEDALRDAASGQRAELLSRRELARQLMGALPGDREPLQPAAAIEIGGVNAGSITAELQPARPVLSQNLLSAMTVIEPHRYRLEPRTRFDGQGGSNAGAAEFKDVDAFGRQFAIAADAQHIYVNNRFQVTAYDRKQAASKWAVAVGSEQGSAHAHRFAQMVPLVVNGALYVRRITKAGIELACLDAATGNMRWHARPGDRGQWLSDPVWTSEGLWLLASHKLDDEWVELRWSRVRSETGEVAFETPLVRLRDAWQGEPPCAVAVRGWNVVASVGGVVACCGLHGELRWVRQEVWLPPKIDPQGNDFLVEPPMIGEETVLISEPSSRAVRCVDIDSGRERWSYTSAALQGASAADDRHVLIAERGALCVCHRDTGALRWRRSTEHRLMATLAGKHVVVAHELPFKSNRSWLQLSWLDTETGEVVAEMPVEADPREDWRIGPWFSTGEQTWALVGQSWRDTNRDVVAFTPVGEKKAGPWRDRHLGEWQTAIEADERRTSQLVLPGWSPFTSAKDALQVPTGEVRGRTPVLLAKLKKDEELQFYRHVSVPEQGSATLVVRAGHQPGQSWRLQVRLNDRTVIDESVEESTSSNGWVEHRVLIGPSTSRTMLVQVAQRNGEKAAEGLWQAIELQTK